MNITRSNLSWIVVADLDEAQHFYVDILGFKLLERSDDIGWLELQGKDGGTKLGIALVNGPVNAWRLPLGSNSIMTLQVDDLERVKKAWEQMYMQFIGKIVEIPGHVKLALFVDKDGNKFQLVQDLV